MYAAEDKNLQIIEQELRFIARHSQTIQGTGGSDFEAVDEICTTVYSALRALDEHKQTLRPEHEESLTGVGLAA